MKKLECIVRPEKLGDIKSALMALEILGMTISEVRGVGRQKGHTEYYRGSEYKVDFLPKLKIEVVIPDELLRQAVDAITNSAKSGKFGDGKIFVFSVEEAIRVRTGELGAQAL
jgi:nitrogen regulatory protein P-II 1